MITPQQEVLAAENWGPSEQAVQTSFPHSKQVGHFQVRWRE